MISTHRPAFLAYNIVLVLHIAAGFIGMYGGLIPLFSTKGGREHRAWGLLFTYAMSFAALTAFPLAWWRHDLFQGAVGLYSGYLALFGFRVLRRHQPKRSAVGDPVLDWALAMIGLSAFLVLVTVGGDFALSGSPETRATGRAALVFGVLGVLVAGRDMQGLMSADNSRARRVLDHLIASSLALLAAFSAFLNTQFHRMTKLDWPIDQKMLLPLLVGLPLLGYWALVWKRGLQGTSMLDQKPPIPLPSELKRLHLFALAEGTSFLLLLFVAVPLKHIGGEDALVRALGPVHGALFVLYVISVFMVRPLLKWRLPRVLVALAAAVLPFGTFLFDAQLRRENVL